jgi:alpha-mannosidase
MSNDLQETPGAISRSSRKDPMDSRKFLRGTRASNSKFSGKKRVVLNRRNFLGLLAAAVGSQIAGTKHVSAAQTQRKVYIVPNFHPASCGWLTTFSKERVYCANSYLTHLDRVGEDPNYAFAMSEINNIIAIMNFRPERIPELKQRIQEKRVELVNGMFLEPTINLSGGEALVRMGVLGLRWYQQMFQLKPRFAWTIDVCGTHEQMAQIVSGLGLDAMVYTRKNPTGKTMFWSVSPNGSKVLTLSPGHYSEAEPIFSSKVPLSNDELRKLEGFFESKDSITPQGAPVLVLGGGDDYSLAPFVKEYPAKFLEQWSAMNAASNVQFSTLSKYVDAVLPGIESGEIAIPTTHAGTAYDFDAFWIENPEVKTLYRRNEHALQAAEMLATIGSLQGGYSYPVKAAYDAWILMLLNMDRNTLWGSAGGMVFVSETSWDVRDRFEWVGQTTTKVLHEAGDSVLQRGKDVGLFNPLNWKRSDPIFLALPKGKSLEGVACEALPDGKVLCCPALPSFSVGGWKLSPQPAAVPQPVDASADIETKFYIARIDRKRGSLTSLKIKPSGRELLGGPANVIVAERPTKKEENPGDFMAPRPGRTRLAASGDQESELRIVRGPVSTTAEAKSPFYGGGQLIRRVRFYDDYPRIDFETELNDIPDYTVVVAEFPLAKDVSEVRRGIPYGFAHSGWGGAASNLPGWNKGIVPAVRWMDFQLSGEGGICLMDRGLSGRELVNNTPIIYLLNAEDQYHKFDNPWTTGKGKHILCYSMVPHEVAWAQAAIPQMAWEYNQAPVTIPQAMAQPFKTFLETSDNIIVEAVRREDKYIELRFAECLGLPGNASVKLSLPHGQGCVTDLMGRTKSILSGSGTYTIPVQPQEIVTLHFETAQAVPVPEPITAWDPFVPRDKLAALYSYSPDVKGHPPFGGGSLTF